MKYWLVKSEPTTFSWDHLWACPNHTTRWDGIRNYGARNNLRAMEVGDQVFFYHSSTSPTVIVGICEVVKAAYPDPAAPDWSAVDLQGVRALDRPVTLDELKKVKALAKMILLNRGRLSVQPVTAAEWAVVEQLGFKKPSSRT